MSFQLPVCSLRQVKRYYYNNNRVIIIKFYDQGTFQKHWLQVVQTTCIKLVDKKFSQLTCIKLVDNLQQTCSHQV